MYRTTLCVALFSLVGLTSPVDADVIVHVANRASIRADSMETSPAGAVSIMANGWVVELALGDVLAVEADGVLRVPAAQRAEDRGLAAEALGNFEVALERYAEAAHHMLRAAEGGAVTWTAAGARLEVYVRRLHFFAVRAEAASRVVEIYSALLERCRDAYCADVTRGLRSRQLRTLGRTRFAAQDDAAQGLVTSFFLVGSFDNERGTGFAEAYGPETQPFDPEATFPGKKRAVRWRPLAVADLPDGLVDLDELMRPNDQALAYAVTYLHAERETPVALRLGSDEAVKMWVNGTPVLSRELRRGYSADQDHVGVVLAKGWNQVLLKVCDQTGGWLFRLRVGAPRGGLASGVRAATLAEIASKPSFPEAVRPVSVHKGGIETLQAAVAASATDWRSRFHLGYLLMLVGAHDQTEHPDQEAIEAAIALAPKNAHLRVMQSYTLERQGEFSVNREDNARRRALEEALAIDPNHHRARLALASYYANQLGNWDRARELIAPTLAKAPGYTDAVLFGFGVDVARGLRPLVVGKLRTLYDRLDESVQREERHGIPADVLARLIRVAESDDDLRRQIELTETLLEGDASNAAWIASLADLYEERGRAETAEQLMRRAIAVEPLLLSLRVDLAKLLERLGRLEDAAATLRGALELAPEDADMVEALGHLEARRGRGDVAEGLYAQAMGLDPNRVDLKKYLKFRARGRERQKRFEDRWIVDPVPLAKSFAREPVDPRRTHRTLFRQEVARVNQDGTQSEFVQEVLRVENLIGARNLASYAAPYKTEQHLEFQKAQVIRVNGAVEDAPVGSSRGRRAGEFGSRRRFSVRFPPLEVGDVVAVRYRVDDVEQGFFGDYYGKIAYFQGETRVDRMRYVLIAPKGRQLYFHMAGLDDVEHVRTEREGAVVHVFERKGIPPLESEPNMPWAKEVIPQVQVSTFKDWDVFSTWYWGLVASQHEADAAIKAKVEELVAGAKTDAEKIRRIYNYVVTDIRYNASWEFGIHGFKPYNATKIFARKFGDCKDKATLIDTMLAVVGIQAHPVLIFGEDRRGREDLTLPLMSHFNHCISWVKTDEDGGLFLDGTAEHHPYATLPTMDYGAKVVVITPDKGVLRDIAFRGPKDNAVKERHVVKVSRGGKATLSTTLEGTGTYGVVLRQVLQTEGRRKDILEPRLGKVFSGAHVKSVETSDLGNLDEAVKVVVEVDVPSVLRRTASGGFELETIRSWLFDVIYLGDQKVSALAADTERTQDVVLQVPSGVEEEIIYELPADMRVESLPRSVTLDQPFATYRLEYVQDGATLRMHRVLEFKTNRIPVEQYEAFRRFVQDVEKAESERPGLSGKGTQQ